MAAAPAPRVSVIDDAAAVVEPPWVRDPVAFPGAHPEAAAGHAREERWAAAARRIAAEAGA